MMTYRWNNLKHILLSSLAFGALVPGLLAPLQANAALIASDQIPQAYTAERAPVYHAFIFANDSYAPLTPIPSAANDFTLMYKFFDKYHYRLWKIGGDGRIHSVQQFYDFMTKAREEIKPGDVVVIYYSGHGFHYGSQNWLVPLDYPSGPVNPQKLYKTAIGLNDVINGLAEKRVDYVVTIMDSCRTAAQFPMAGSASGGEASVPDPRLTSFNFSGPSLLAWLIGAPTQNGGQALGVNSATEPSLYTGMLAKIFETQTRLGAVQRELKNAVIDLQLSGKIGPDDISPRLINNDVDFDFSPQIDPLVIARQMQDWMNVMRTPSKRLVKSYLILNPGSSYSTAAWKYMDDHVADPVDSSSGSTATDAEKIDASFPEGKVNGKLIAIATPGFKIKFPRNALGHAPTSAETMADAIVYADKAFEIPKILAQRYSEKGSKLNFDVSQLQGAGSLKGDIELFAISEPKKNAQVLAQFNNTTSYKIGETLLEGADNTLFARVQTGINGEPTSESTWIRVASDPKSFEFNNVNRALQESYISPAGLLGQSSEPTVKAAVVQAQKESNEILWVSVAVEDKTIDLAPLQQKLKEAPDERTRADIDLEIERVIRSNENLLAEADLRSLDARLQLIDAGIGGTRISIVGDKSGDLGQRVRLRFFGSR
ncbi:hypothetical protein B5K11_26280 [Rhizobium leguminosarum bv. trifolii]|uniref:caspase family protein n=1 Tax=Rhizobium leguminosarum TaxID=384 RepID=UPI000E2EB1B2|nr:caspase family protein [Rhizobium leguminosarum]RFB87655.1 hypothetical protein B5K11_26280 [Rhizobium leguminosarum bv. trifolii]